MPSVSFPAADVSDGSTALPGMIFAINHLANIIHLLMMWDEQLITIVLHFIDEYSQIFLKDSMVTWMKTRWIVSVMKYLMTFTRPPLWVKAAWEVKAKL